MKKLTPYLKKPKLTRIMTTIQILTVGKLKGGFSYLQPGIDDYLKRLRPYASVSLIEVPDETIHANQPIQRVLDAEAKRLLPYFQRASYKAVLWEKGELVSSLQFAQALEKRMLLGTNPSNGGISPTGSGPMILVIGGAHGVSPHLLDLADWHVSLSPMTFPHPLVRLILLEQLYRAFKILRNEPYHK